MLTENKKIVTVMSLKMSKTKIDKSYMWIFLSHMTIQQDPTNPIPSAN